ncbi:MAG: hypothetical protein R2793_00865 [Flavobacteriaceae bacterium]
MSVARPRTRTPCFVKKELSKKSPFTKCGIL